MTNLTTEKCRTLIERLSEDQRACRISIFGELYLQALEIALPVLEQQGGWISCSERMPPSKTGVLVGCWYGREWATKWASLIHGHPDASNEGWLIPGASWVPTHWHPLPASPQQPKTDTYRQIENDGWIEWKGGRCPVSANDNVEIKLRDGGSCEGPGAHILNWANRGFQSDIIAYRVIENDGREG
ncbi:DUF551 domain-containing protein [Pantoea dispersa]|uniref:DUF551 domain-containing protein n=1 Tax=Pantoea dispersa TaxID=59814 RepID=UPI00301AFD5D